MVGAARGDEEEEVAPPPTSIAAVCAASILPRRILFHPPLRAPPPSSSSALTPLNLPPLDELPPSSSQHSSGDRPPSSVPNSSVLPSRPARSLSSTLVKRIGAGLNNLGNTCFLNSVLQCLTYTPPLATCFQEGLHKSSCRAVAFCAMCALENHVKQALSAPGRVISPNQLVKNLRCISRSFHMGRQEDAHEYMRYLIEALQKCCPLDVHAKASPSSQRNYIQKIFGGRLQSQVKCMECAHSSNTYDPFLDLSLDIVKAESLLKALSRFTAIEVLDGDNKYFCSRCKKKVRAHKQFTIDYAPHVLTVQFKRFSSSGGFGGKIDKKVHFDRTLNLTPFVNGKEGGIRYSLYAVLVHAGWSTHSGHYFCFVRTSADIWHRLDDCRVSQVSEKSVLEQKAYILFYIRDSESVPISNGNHHGGGFEKSNVPHTNGVAQMEANVGHKHEFGNNYGKGAVRGQTNGFATASITDHLSKGAPKRIEVLGNGKPMKAPLTTSPSKMCNGEVQTKHQSSTEVEANGGLVNGHTGKNAKVEANGVLVNGHTGKNTKVEVNGVVVNGYSGKNAKVETNSVSANGHIGKNAKVEANDVLANGHTTKNSKFEANRVLANGHTGKNATKVEINGVLNHGHTGKNAKVEANGVLVDGHTGKNKGAIVRNEDRSGPSIHSQESLLSSSFKVPESFKENEVNGVKTESINGGCTGAKEGIVKQQTLKKFERQGACFDDIAAGASSNKKNSTCDKRVISLPLSNADLLPVPRWEEGEHGQGHVLKERCALGEEVAHCGHLLDEWDEEYDRGKRKKVKSRIPLQQELVEASEHVWKRRKNCGTSQEHYGLVITSKEGCDNLFQALAGKKVEMGVDSALLKKHRKRERVRGHKLFIKRHRFKQLHANRRHRRKH